MHAASAVVAAGKRPPERSQPFRRVRFKAPWHEADCEAGCFRGFLPLPNIKPAAHAKQRFSEETGKPRKYHVGSMAPPARYSVVRAYREPKPEPQEIRAVMSRHLPGQLIPGATAPRDRHTTVQAAKNVITKCHEEIHVASKR